MSAPRSHHVTLLSTGHQGVLEIYRRADPDDGFGSPVGTIEFWSEGWQVHRKAPDGRYIKKLADFGNIRDASEFAREHFGREQPA